MSNTPTDLLHKLTTKLHRIGREPEDIIVSNVFVDALLADISHHLSGGPINRVGVIRGYSLTKQSLIFNCSYGPVNIWFPDLIEAL